MDLNTLSAQMKRQQHANSRVLVAAARKRRLGRAVPQAMQDIIDNPRVVMPDLKDQTPIFQRGERNGIELRPADYTGPIDNIEIDTTQSSPAVPMPSIEGSTSAVPMPEIGGTPPAVRSGIERLPLTPRKDRPLEEIVWRGPVPIKSEPDSQEFQSKDYQLWGDQPPEQPEPPPPPPKDTFWNDYLKTEPEGNGKQPNGKVRYSEVGSIAADDAEGASVAGDAGQLQRQGGSTGAANIQEITQAIEQSKFILDEVAEKVRSIDQKLDEMRSEIKESGTYAQ